MHINFESKMCVLCAYYRLWANPIPKNIDSFYTQNESLYNKLCFDIKGFVVQRRTYSLQSDELHT